MHPTGRRTQIVELDGRTSTYTYNDLYWLTGEGIIDAVNGNYSASYKYDKVGNRTQGVEAGVTTAYSYDDNDRLTQQGGVTYAYDENGNTLSEDNEGAITSYTYNSQNQLTGHSVAGTNTRYQYNPAGIRHSQNDLVATIDYLVDANRDYAQVLAESINGVVDVGYHHGDDLISQSRGAEAYYYHTDGLGSTRVLTDSSGTTTDTYAYSAFGEVLNQVGFTDNSYLYTGEQYDEGLDQYYLRARYYDQGVGRFTQMDSWMGRNQDPTTLHKFLYANADPILMVDPSGHFSLAQTFATVNTIGNLVDLGISSYNSFFTGDDGSGVSGSDTIPTPWDYIMAYTIRALATSISTAPVANIQIANAVSVGKPDKHHTIPIYTCGHNSQQRASISKSDHKAIHAKLYNFKTVINLAGTSYNLLFKKRARGATEAPLQLVAGTVMGRTAIVSALGVFYTSEGYMSTGNPAIGTALAIEGPRFIGGHTSIGRNCRR